MLKLLINIYKVIDHIALVYACPVLDVIIIVYLTKLYRVFTEIAKGLKR